MERLLSRLERSLGRHVPEGLPIWLVALSALGYVITYAKPEVYPLLLVNREALAQGEVWRFVTFLFAPLAPIREPIDFLWVFFGLQILYTMMSSLEAQWGAFRFALFWLVGALGTATAAVIAGAGTPIYLDVSILLAFATLFPDYQLMILFVLPLKVKWLGILSGLWLAWSFVSGGLGARAEIVAGIANYLLFCGPTLAAAVRGRVRRPSAASRAWASPSAEPARKPRVCAKCGRSEADDPGLEFRVCDCEKCGGRLTDYCLEHARNH